MQVARIVIQAHQLHRAGNLVGEQRVAKTEQRIDRVGRWALDPANKGPLPRIGNELAKAAKVGRAACPFHAKDRLERSAYNPMISTHERFTRFRFVHGQSCQLTKQISEPANHLTHFRIRLRSVVSL